MDQAYQEAFTPEEAIGDMPDILAAVKGDPVRIEFYQQEGQPAGTLSLKIFHREGHLPLSRRVPLLENLGFNVISERTFDIGVVADGEKHDIVLHDMELSVAASTTLDLPHYGQKLEEAFLAAFSGKVDNDNFNRLILACGLTVREVSVLRAYARYLRQTESFIRRNISPKRSINILTSPGIFSRCSRPASIHPSKRRSG